MCILYAGVFSRYKPFLQKDKIFAKLVISSKVESSCNSVHYEPQYIHILCIHIMVYIIYIMYGPIESTRQEANGSTGIYCSLLRIHMITRVCVCVCVCVCVECDGKETCPGAHNKFHHTISKALITTTHVYDVYI